MLSELNDIQEDDEDYRMTKMRFAVQTENTDDGELVEKEYTFSWGEQFEEWHFMRYKEKRTPDTNLIKDRNWRTVQDIWWSEAEPVDIEVPQIVNEKIADRLGADEVSIRIP